MQTPVEKKKKKNIWIVPLLLGLIVALLIRSFLLNLTRVDGSSMMPNLQNNELVLNWHLGEVKRGSVIVFDASGEDPSISNSGSSTYIKRVIGLPGDTVEYRNGNLYVDGTKVNQNWISKEEQLATSMGMDDAAGWSLESLSLSLNWQDKDRNTRVVPKNTYFVLGDKRSISKDSRQFGFVDKSSVKGTATLPFWAGDSKTRKNINDVWRNFFINNDKSSSSSKTSSSTTSADSETNQEDLDLTEEIDETPEEPVE